MKHCIIAINAYRLIRMRGTLVVILQRSPIERTFSCKVVDHATHNLLRSLPESATTTNAPRGTLRPSYALPQFQTSTLARAQTTPRACMLSHSAIAPEVYGLQQKQPASGRFACVCQERSDPSRPRRCEKGWDSSRRPQSCRRYSPEFPGLARHFAERAPQTSPDLPGRSR
jgi:hypothetical protein